MSILLRFLPTLDLTMQFRILKAVNDPEALNKMTADRFTDLFVTA